MKKRKKPADYSGLDLYAALQRISMDFPDLSPADIDLRYIESSLPRFTVLSCGFHEAPGSPERLRIQAASPNPIRHLPSNYQENAFLRGFLMVFQHIMNETTLKIDKLDAWFRPMECPPEFLPVLADWLGVRTDTPGSGEHLRRFIRSALSLYRCRGTALGLRAYLGIVCGVTPQLIEGEFPRASHAGMSIRAEDENPERIFEAEEQSSSFTIHFPVPREKFSDDLLRRLSLIAQREKPAHTVCYISFARPAKKRRKITAIREDTYLNGEDGFFI